MCTHDLKDLVNLCSAWPCLVDLVYSSADLERQEREDGLVEQKSSDFVSFDVARGIGGNLDWTELQEGNGRLLVYGRRIKIRSIFLFVHIKQIDF